MISFPLPFYFEKLPPTQGQHTSVGVMSNHICRKDIGGTTDAADNTDTVVTSNIGGTTETVVTINSNTSTVITTNKGGTTQQIQVVRLTQVKLQTILRPPIDLVTIVAAVAAVRIINLSDRLL